MNDWASEVSIPSLSIPPLSLRFRVILALPIAPGTGVKVSVPTESIAGGTLNKAALSFPTTSKARVCPDSLAGPGEIAAAHPGMVCGPELLLRVRSPPLTNEGASLTGLTAIELVKRLVLN